MSNESINKRIAYLEFLNRENSVHHHTYDEELIQYEYVRKGDLRSVEEAKKLFASSAVGHLSDDPLRNRKYLFVCSVTLVTRFAIEGGMESEKAYAASDLYIQQADSCTSIKAIDALLPEMVAFYTREVAAAKKGVFYSKPVLAAMDYIYYHLSGAIRLKELAKVAGVNASYLSTLFKKETGSGISTYITGKRIVAAENMLRFSSYSLAEIGEYMGFSSYSHFAKTFRQYNHMSPGEFRKSHFRHAGFGNRYANEDSNE